MHEHHAILIGVKPVPRAYPHALNLHCKVELALLAFFGRHGHGRKRPYPRSALRQFGDVAHAAINDDTRPAIPRGRHGQVASKQGAAQGCTAIHDQHPASPSRLYCGLDERIVLKAFEGDHLPAEFLNRAKVPEYGW